VTLRKTPDVTFVVYRGLDKVYEDSVPASRMSETNADVYLRVLYARFSEMNDRDWVQLFVNGRRGVPRQHYAYRCDKVVDWEKSSINRFCGDSRCMSIAITPIDPETLTFLRQVQSENRRPSK
jgi:hypothetical protein